MICGGSQQLMSLSRLPVHLQQFAYAQDLIGWGNFMLGMISSHLRAVQHSHLLSAPSLLTADDWLKQFINKLLHITHGQWIYHIPQYIQYHDSIGQIQKAERRHLLLEIDLLMHLKPEDLPEESKFLLEVDFARLRNVKLTSQQYWVHAVKAAVSAHSRKTFLQRRRQAAASGCRRATTEPPIPYGEQDDTAATSALLLSGSKRCCLGSGSTDDKSNKRRRPD
jgi:hypothetical protein